MSSTRSGNNSATRKAGNEHTGRSRRIGRRTYGAIRENHGLRGRVVFGFPRRGLRAPGEKRRRKVLTRAMPARSTETLCGQRGALSGRRLEEASDPHGAGRCRSRGSRRPTRDDGGADRQFLPPSLPVVESESRRASPGSLRRPLGCPVRTPVQGAEERGDAGRRPGPRARAPRPGRPDARPGRGRAESSLCGVDRRARRPRDDGLHHDARSRRHRGDCHAGRDREGRPPGPRRGNRNAQVPVPPDSLRQPHDGNAHGLWNGARRFRGGAGQRARLGDRSRRFELRRLLLRAFPLDRRRLRRGGLGDVARRDLPGSRGGRAGGDRPGTQSGGRNTMRGFGAVARREIGERRSVFVAAAVLGLLPFLAPLLPLWRRYGAPEVRLYTAAFFAVAFAAALSLMLGASTIRRDLSEGRLGFYFSRPIGSGAIWAGKLAGVWLLVVLAAAVILLPAGLFDFSAWWRETRSGGLVGYVAIAFAFAVVVFLALGNVISLAFRSRPVWVAGDLVCLALWALTLWSAVMPLLLADAPVLTLRVALGAFAACSVALLAAGGAQVAVGRVDVVRGGRARFAVLWILLFALTGIAFGYVRWLLSPAPSNLLAIGIDAVAPRGSWIEISGFARGRADYRASLFYDVASGRFVRARAGRDGAIAFSDDGTAAAWTERSTLDARGPQDVWICRFDAPEMRRVRTPISARVWNIVMSPGGSRLAVMEEKTISVFEVPSGRLLAAAATDFAKHYLRIVFLSEQKLRIYRMGPLGAIAAGEAASALASIGILDFEIDARKMKETASIENVRRPFSIGFNDRGERLIVWEKRGQVSLFDASTGRRLAPLGPGGWDTGTKAFLSDGRPILSESAGGNGRVHLFSKDGQEERVYDVGRAGLVRLGGEPAAGRITLAIGPAPYIWGASDAFLLDVNSGPPAKPGAHLSQIAAHMRWRLPQPEPGSEATRLFARADGSVVRLDPQTESLKTIFPKR